MDPLRSSLLSETDANGNRTDLAYDPLGRLTAVWLADRDKERNAERPSLKFEYNIRTDAPSSVVTHELDHRGDYAASYEIYDGLLRPRQQQSPGIGGRLISDVFYDSRGNAVLERESYPNDEKPGDKLFVVNNEDEIPRQTESVYDGAGRQTATIQRSRGKEVLRTSVQELGDRTLVTVPDGDTASTTLYDTRGRTTEVRQHHGNKPEGSYDATTYTYTKADELASVTDPAGNVWRYSYDLRGRKTKTVDPDAGTSTFEYDDLDQLVSQTDGRGRTLAYTYDELGRQTGVFDDSPKGAQRVGMVYDTVQKGQLTSATRYSGDSAYTQRVVRYNKLYQPLVTEIGIPASEGVLSGKFQFSTDYNPDGSVQGIVLPKAGKLPRELVQYQYNEIGLPTLVQAGRDKIISEAKYSKIGELVQREYHKGNSGSKKTWATYDYDLRNGRLKSISTVPEIGSGSLSHQTYGYDDAGNVTSISDKPTAEGLAADTQCFAYDSLRRLTDAWTPKPGGEDDDTGTCGQEPSTDKLGGAAPYWHSYSYDKVGNRLTETRHSQSGDVKRSYTHPDPGQLQPHALKKVEETGPEGDRLEKYDYDESGNMTGRLTAEHDQNLEWDAEGNLVKVTENDGGQATTYTYDANGDRLIRRDAQSSTLYLPGMELRFDATTQKTEATRYYEHAGETVAVREDDGSLSWLVSDHHGTGQLAIDATTGEVAQRRFTAFGEERSSTGEWPGEKGFVGGTIDASTGLTQLGARAYDAAIGRFISVDPVMDPTDAQQMHGYVYSNNNPVTWSDPSGLFLSKAWNWTKSKVKKGVKKAKSVYNKGKKYVKKQYKKAKKYVKKKYHQAKRYVRKKYTQARRYVRKAYAKTKSYVRTAYRKTSAFVRKHKNTIIATGVGIAVGAACTAATAGAGAIGCAALGGAASSLVQYQLDTPKDQWSVTGALGATAMGGAFGAAGGAIGGKVASAAANRMSSGTGLSSRVGSLFSRSKGGGASSGRGSGTCPVGNSFIPGTGVLMADGSKKPIEDVDVGDKVIATDPETGEQSEKTVLATIVGAGSKDLVEITIDTTTERPADTELSPDKGGLNGNGGLPGPLAGGDIIISTEGHPFWVPELGEWLDAGDLRPGMWLETSSGTWVQVTATRAWTQPAKVHNLTVEGVHTFNVAVGASSDVLTHNCGGSINPGLVRFSQDSVGKNFSNGMSIEHVAAGLRSKWISAGDIPPIRLTVRNGNLFTLDNRRLVAFQKAGVPAPFRMATAEEAASEAWKFTTVTNGRSILIRGTEKVWSP
nr:RHS repeat-associated core domain-containing protein [Nocardiopsis mwathae]